MELSGLLLKVLGIYSLIMGILMLTRKSVMVDFLKGFKSHAFAARLMGALELFLGLMLVLGFPSWRGPDLVVVIVGIAALAEGAFYLFSTHKTIMHLVSRFLRPGWYYTSAILILLFGIIMTGVGFSLL